MAAQVGFSSEDSSYFREHPPTLENSIGRRAIVERRTLHVHDTSAGRVLVQHQYQYPQLSRTMLAVPLKRNDQIIGVITLARVPVHPFSTRQIELLETFADQAVIAIEHTRLLDELASWTKELEARVETQVGEIERMQRLRRFLSPQVADLVLASGQGALLEAHRREVTVVFCDLRGFTQFAEAAEPEEVIRVIGEYHATLGPIINEYEGTLERFTGDGLLVFFNDPVPCPNPAERAVRLAIDARNAVNKLINGWERVGIELGFGVGIAKGYATLGKIGFDGRYDYAAIGTVTNLGARLCGEAKSGQIVIAQRVAADVEAIVDLEPLGALTLKGFRAAVRAHNVVRIK